MSRICWLLSRIYWQLSRKINNKYSRSWRRPKIIVVVYVWKINIYLGEDRSRAKTQGLSSEERWCWWQIERWLVAETRWEPHIACLLKAVVLLSTLYTHENAEHNRKQFLEILFLMVSFRLLISDLRGKSVTILILCFLFEEWVCLKGAQTSSGVA